MKMILLMMMCNSIMFSATVHPLSMGLLLIIQTMLTAMLINMMLKTSWFSFIVVIVLLGGMLVLFIYMASMASNEKFNSSVKLTPIIATIACLLTIMMVKSPELMTVSPIDLSMSTNILMLNKMFNTKNTSVTIMMMVYLMYTMISINNIVKINEGPLRKKN